MPSTISLDIPFDITVRNAVAMHVVVLGKTDEWQSETN
jgi:hypothetical protein